MSKYWINSDQLKELANAENGNQIFVLLTNISRTQKLETQRTESLTKGLVTALVEFNKHWSGTPLHLQSVPLTKNQYNNFQKLQYHGLVEHIRTGYWSITANGALFLDGHIAMPKSVTIDDGQVIDRSSQKVTLSKLLSSNPGHSFAKRQDYLD